MKPLSGSLLLTCLAVLCFPLGAQAAKAPPPIAQSAEARAFIDEMHERHGFDADELTRQFGAVRVNPTVLKAIRPAAVPEQQRSWQRYRERFVNDRRIDGGLRFWRAHAQDIARAESDYGVPGQIIVAIIGVETEYGRNVGKFSVLEALATLAFGYPPRAAFFRGELEQFLLLAHENAADPLGYRGSYAGAIGVPQFMPSSQRRYAVDFDGDGRVDLRASVSDAIGSVARFLALHGWRADEPVAVPAVVTADPAALIAAGIRPTTPFSALKAQGVVVAAATEPPAAQPSALIDLVTPGTAPEYWVGFDNFYAITRYNRSSFYAMSVFQLAEALREARVLAGE